MLRVIAILLLPSIAVSTFDPKTCDGLSDGGEKRCAEYDGCECFFGNTGRCLVNGIDSHSGYFTCDLCPKQNGQSCRTKIHCVTPALKGGRHRC
ncbi:Ecp31 [Fulvia fulva]|uniref:Ecp31 n=1 Tax=Passalora fulva TaxID=5499 RepID=A0A1P8YXJ6_PASFU|nr:Ecp31 [Fulvia fulva]AQA29230.1 extracellular protein 31 [Fulvia fulva]KAK4616166.1 Ecp31 [Fulvia fulva]KAK4616972.1 Ecp31 [Fulvia fulva]UJO22662.1 Ecp31 [Fulvia fulva]WPV18848.1 Ecp31 [Fulvia fulva]